MSQKRHVYADNAATTMLSPKALEAMLPWLGDCYGNASSAYGKGREARRAVEKSREQTATALNASEPGEITFTSGGTESDNWAIKSAAKMMASQGKRHIVTSVFEHHAVLHSVKALEREGFSATYVGVGADGVLRAKDVSSAIREDTALVSIMLANNEIGTIQPIAEIGAACRDRGVLFHTDAVQAVGTIPIDVQKDSIDLLSLSAHKFHGPKGIGALYIRKGILLPPYQDGGTQERGKRAGTENVPAIVGLGAAIEEALSSRETRVSQILRLRNRLLEVILPLPGVSLNGDRERRLPGNINAAFQGIQGESLLLMLDLAGVAASSASACSTGTEEPSHVLKAIGLSDEAADSSLRLSLGGYNDDADVDYLLEVIPATVEKLRRVVGYSFS